MGLVWQLEPSHLHIDTVEYTFTFLLPSNFFQYPFLSIHFVINFIFKDNQDLQKTVTMYCAFFFFFVKF